MDEKQFFEELVELYRQYVGVPAAPFDPISGACHLVLPDSTVLAVSPSGLTYAVKDGMGGLSVIHLPTGKKPIMIMVPKPNLLTPLL